MEPVFGFALYFFAVVAVAVVAGKRGLAWWAYALACLVGGPMFVMLVGSAGGRGVAAGFGAFVIPAAALFFALSSNTDERSAVVGGKSESYRKCPFCAEAVRKEAVKCKHCHSDLPSFVEVSTPSASQTVSNAPDEYLQTMAHYGITFNREKYWFGEYAYDKLSDAVNYAKAKSA